MASTCAVHVVHSKPEFIHLIMKVWKGWMKSARQRQKDIAREREKENERQTDWQGERVPNRAYLQQNLNFSFESWDKV